MNADTVPVASTLDAIAPLERGYLLACSWAGRDPDSGTEARLQLPPSGRLTGACETLRGLSDAERTEIASRWIRSETPRRIERELDLHWSWYVEELERVSEAPTLILVLSLLSPEKARALSRRLWSRLRNAPEDVMVSRPEPGAASLLRRCIHAGFLLRRPDGNPDGICARLARLGRDGLHLVVQDLGSREIARHLLDGPRRAIILAALSAAGSEHARRIEGLGRNRRAPSEALLPGEHLLGLLKAAILEARDPISACGIDLLSRVLAELPRSLCVGLAQKMDRALGSALMQARDARTAGPGSPEQVKVELDAVLAGRASRGGLQDLLAG